MGKRVAYYGVLVALAFIFSYVESFIVIPVPIPGIKLGLANLVVVVALYVLDAKAAFVISVVRILLVGLTFGNMFSMVYALSGGLLSCALMVLAKKHNRLSTVGVSILGGVSHNIGQILVAMLVLESTDLVYYLPMLLVAGALTGAVIGIVGQLMIERLKFNFIK